MEKGYLLLVDGEEILTIAQSDANYEPADFGAEALSALANGHLADFWKRWKVRDFPPGYTEATFKIQNFIRNSASPKNREDYPRYTYTIEKNTGTFRVYHYGVELYAIRKNQQDAGLFAMKHETDLNMLLSVSEEGKTLTKNGRMELDIMLQNGISADYLSGLMMASPVVAIPKKDSLIQRVTWNSQIFLTTTLFAWLPRISHTGAIDPLEMHRSEVLTLQLIPQKDKKSRKTEFFFPRITIWDEKVTLDWEFLSTLYGKAEIGADKLEQGLTKIQCWRVVQSLLEESTQTTFLAVAVAGEVYRSALETLFPFPNHRSRSEAECAIESLEDTEAAILSAVMSVCGKEMLANETFSRSIVHVIEMINQSLEERKNDLLALFPLES